MNPVLLLIPVAGVILVIFLVFLVWGKDEVALGDAESLQKKFQKEYPGHSLRDILIDSPKHCALAWDQKNEHLVIFYVHGIHANIRELPKQNLLRSELEDGKNGDQILHLHIKAFDRSHFSLSFSADTMDKQSVAQWYEQLRQIGVPA